MESEKIKRIERKKKIPLKDKIYEKINNLQISFVQKHYKDEKLLWRVIYDRLYRIDLFDYIMNSDGKYLNISRNIFNINEEKYKYLKLDKNLLFEDDIYIENNFLINHHNYYLMEKLSFILLIPNILFFTLAILKRSKSLFFCLTFCFIINFASSGDFIKTKFTKI